MFADPPKKKSIPEFFREINEQFGSDIRKAKQQLRDAINEGREIDKKRIKKIKEELDFFKKQLEEESKNPKPNPLPGFSKDIIKRTKNIASGLSDTVRDFRDSRITYDGCNASIRIGNNGYTQFYRNKYCPLPPKLPSNLEQRLRELDLTDCGQDISFRFTFVTKVISDTLRVVSSMKEILAVYKKKNPNYDGNFKDFVEGSGGFSNQRYTVDLGGGVTYYYLVGVGVSNLWEGNPQTYPYYNATQITASTRNGGKGHINTVLDAALTSSTGRKAEVYEITASTPNNQSCPLGKPDRDPPPPRKKKEDCCMCCDKIENNDALLRLILKRIGSLPANVPDDFTKQKPTMISIESLADLMFWQMDQLDALMGAYPIEIEIEDSDLTKEGNQNKKISIPNQAEGMAELLGLALTIKRDTHATLIAAIKAMAEAGMSKQLGIKTLDVALSNAEFLGYKLEQKKKKIPSLFTPGGKDTTETLQEKEIEIVTYENTDKNDLQDDLKTLKTMAARWNAQNWKKVSNDNPGQDLKDHFINGIKAITETGKTETQDDFNDFTEQCERGFIDVSGISDTESPWGRQYKERPKIREIGTDKSRYNDDGTEKG